MFKTYLSLDHHDKELVEECDIVARVVAVPDRQEDQSAELAQVLVVQEPKTLVHVGQHPAVGIDIEGFDQMLELLASLEPEN